MAPLLDRLREIEDFTPSRHATGPEALELLGKVIAYLEHGDELLEAAQRDRDAKAAGEPANHVNELLSPPEPEPEPSSAPGSEQELAQLRARLAALEQEQQTAKAVEQRTTPVDTSPATSLGPGAAPPGVTGAPAPEGQG